MQIDKDGHWESTWQFIAKYNELYFSKYNLLISFVNQPTKKKTFHLNKSLDVFQF